MTFYQRQTKILSLGLPIIAGMLSQSVLNLIDAALVGQLGETALAGVGVGSYANFVVVSLILGLSSGFRHWSHTTVAQIGMTFLPARSTGVCSSHFCLPFL